MIDLRQIDETIDDIKRNGTTRKAAEQLALMYIVRDHLSEETKTASVERMIQSASFASASSQTDENASEFRRLADAAPYNVLMDIMDEHMTCVAVMFPKEYNAIISELKQI